MARARANRTGDKPFSLPQVDDPSTLTAVEKPQFDPPKGLDLENRLSALDQGCAAWMENFRVDYGSIVTRPYVARIGPATATEIMEVTRFHTSDGTEHIIRFTTVGVDEYDVASDSWIAYSGTALTAGKTNFISYTGWGDKLLFTNGVDGLFEVDLGAQTYTAIAAGYAARQITTFGSRVIECGTLEGGTTYRYRMRWSVKDNDQDFTGQGSGYEDLVGFPGENIGLYPITDKTAFLVRANSVWQVSLSGYADAPFTFDRVFPQVPAQATRAIVPVPGGVILITADDVYQLTLSGVKPLGRHIRQRLLTSILDKRFSFAVFDIRTQTFAVAVRESSATADATAVYRMAFVDDAWTRDVYPFDIRAMSYDYYNISTLKASQLPGKANTLPGLASELGVSARTGGLLMVANDTATGNCAVMQEDPTATQDMQIDGTLVDAVAVIRTGLLLAGSKRERTIISELQLEYEAAADVLATLKLTYDAGATWETVSTQTLAATKGPTVASMTFERTGHNMQLELQINKLRSFYLNQFVPLLTRGGRVFS